jgi:hypothetical protein
MKYYSKLGLYKNSTGTNELDRVTGAAFSYGWWQYLKRYGSVSVFNYHSYSVTTSKHQRACLDIVGYDHIFVDIPGGLQYMSVECIISVLGKNITSLRKHYLMPRRRKATRYKYRALIREEISKIRVLRTRGL